MFLQKVRAYSVGLVFKNGAYARMLKEGWNFVWPNETVYDYDMDKQFMPPYELSVLLKDEQLKEMLYVEEVKDNEIVLLFEANIFKRVLTAGRYAFWKGIIDYSFVKVDLGKIEITEAIDKAVLMRTEVLQYVRLYTVSATEKGLLFVNNQYVKVLEPGNYFFWKNSIPVTVMGADMRQLQLDISGQEILTKDKAALRVNFIAQYRVKDVEKAMIANKDYEKQL